MTNKYDERRSDGPRASAPSPATETPAHEPERGDGPRRRRNKGKTEMPLKELNAELQTRHNVIGAGLKRIFDEIVEEPIPSEFLELLDKIDLKRDQ
jgi:hypothetical protein